MTKLITSWDLPAWAQFATIMMAINVMFAIPAWGIFNFYMRHEIQDAVEAGIQRVNIENKADHKNIKDAIILNHPDYNTYHTLESSTRSAEPK